VCTFPVGDHREASGRPLSAQPAAPPMPRELAVFTAEDWLLPTDPPEPADGYDVPAWGAFAAAHRAAYARHNESRARWYDNRLAGMALGGKHQLDGGWSWA
jgi:hypothetical protein